MANDAKNLAVKTDLFQVSTSDVLMTFDKLFFFSFSSTIIMLGMTKFNYCPPNLNVNIVFAIALGFGKSA